MKILNVLDALDRHSFERIDLNNSLDTLYSKIFLPPNSKDNSNSLISVGNSVTTENDTLKDNRSEYVSIAFYLYENELISFHFFRILSRIILL